MLTALQQVPATEGIWLLVVAALLAGLVRGFSGFGTAMVYLPFAGQVLDPLSALITLMLIDFFGPVPALPRALREAHTRDVLRLGAGALVGLPLGLAVLLVVAPGVFRVAVSTLTLVQLGILLSGLRYRGVVPRPMIYGIGTLSGFLGGAVGLSGPPVILLYMARALPVEVIRASILLFLMVTDLILFGTLSLRGLLTAEPLAIGFCLILPYLLAASLGARLFDPTHVRLYRRVAYSIIAASAILGLPLWD